jgi:bifunctional DNA-binding transcriptional regulator/antitoxin component of YhaV-PrlF toxin-antitoxin module
VIVGQLVLQDLPKEIRDRIELREQTDQTFYRFSEEDYTELFWNMVLERSDPGVEHSLILSTYGSQGSGKSWSAISVCSMLDPVFSVDRIFFSYQDLVKNRASIKPNSAVLLDEQTQSYGIDSHRVMIILNGIKEQLRKKSIHLIFCSPVLHEEAQTSMYHLEIFFIDKSSQEAVAALYTREGHCLGHVRIPSPLKPLEDGVPLQTKEFMDAYEQKKDDHLEKLLGQKSVDMFEDLANTVMATDLFKRADKIYRAKVGYVPQGALIQLVNKLFPDYNSGVVPGEIAQRIKFNKEMDGSWLVPGGKKKTRE